MLPESDAVTSLPERAVAGLHDFLIQRVIPQYVQRKGRAVDLGAGSGALALRLQTMGLEVLAVDLDSSAFQADVPFLRIDLNDRDFPESLGPESFQLVTAVEVIEHLESPVAFLRNIGRLLEPNGTAIITTPNVDNLPARLKFLLTGKLRMMDERGDQTHISPIFWDLFVRQYLPRAGLQLVAHYVYPPRGYSLTRPRYAWVLGILARILPGDALFGDSHVAVLKRA